MLEKRIVDVTIGKQLRKKLAELAASSGLSNPIPGLTWGKWDDEDEESYFIGFYEKKELPTKDPIRIIEADGIELLIIQDWICEELEGKTLDIVNRKLTLF